MKYILHCEFESVSPLGSGIKTLEDIRGRRIALSSLAALGAGVHYHRSEFGATFEAEFIAPLSC